MPAKDLFPEIEPYDTGFLALSAPHRMYYEQCGNPKGVPVVFLHGGPGAGANATHRRFFDPAFYRIVIFDSVAAAGPSHWARSRTIRRRI
jgi:proline iminopeptidase